MNRNLEHVHRGHPSLLINHVYILLSVLIVLSVRIYFLTAPSPYIVFLNFEFKALKSLANALSTSARIIPPYELDNCYSLEYTHHPRLPISHAIPPDTGMFSACTLALQYSYHTHLPIAHFIRRNTQIISSCALATHFHREFLSTPMPINPSTHHPRVPIATPLTHVHKPSPPARLPIHSFVYINHPRVLVP